MLGPSLSKCQENILKILEANEARGRRKFIRAFCNPQLDTFNILANGNKLEGSLFDISIAGMAIGFNNQAINLSTGLKLNNVQLVLRGTICTVSGTIVYKREGENKDIIYIILFDPKQMNPQTKDRIHNFIYQRLQDEMKKSVSEIERQANRQKPEPERKTQEEQMQEKSVSS